MKKDVKFYLQLFWETFLLSAFTFGGGYVIVPLMRKKFVEQLHWIDEKEMLDLIALAQCSPGAMAVNASILVGYRLAGVLGALITVLATVTPPLLIISAISVGYTAFRDSTVVARVLRGMQAGVAAVICSVVFQMASEIIKQKRASAIVVMVLVFVLSALLHVNVMLIILLCGVIGMLDMLWQNKHAVQKEEKP